MAMAIHETYFLLETGSRVELYHEHGLGVFVVATVVGIRDIVATAYLSGLPISLSSAKELTDPDYMTARLNASEVRSSRDAAVYYHVQQSGLAHLKRLLEGRSQVLRVLYSTSV